MSKESLAKMKEWRAQRRAQGLCEKCGKPVSPKSSRLCEKHLKERREKERKYRQRMKRIPGLCRQCYTRQSIPGLVWCGVCAERHTAAMATMRAKRVARGLCGVCGKHPVVEGMKICQVCRDKAKAKRAERKEAGMCATCGKRPNTAGQPLCQNCRNNNRRDKARERSIKNALYQ